MRDELELAKLVDDTEIAGRLQARAYARIEKYLAPTKWQQVVRKRGVFLRIGAGVVAAVGVSEVLQTLVPEGSSTGNKAFIGLGTGAVIGTVAAVFDEWRKSRAILERAEEQVEVVTADLRAARYADHDSVEKTLADLKIATDRLERATERAQDRLARNEESQSGESS